MKNFLYNNDKSQILAAKNVAPTVHVSMLESELNILNQGFKEVVFNPKDFEVFSQKLKTYMGLLSFFKIDLTRVTEQSYQKFNFRNTLLSHVESAAPSNQADINYKGKVERTLQKHASGFTVSCPHALIYADKNYGLHASLKHKFPLLIEAQNVTDTTPVARIPKNTLQMLSSFKGATKDLEVEIKFLMSNPQYAPIFETKTVQLNWQMYDHPNGIMTFLKNMKTAVISNYSIAIPLTSFINKLISFNASINGFIDINGKDYDKILTQAWTPCDWNGSLDNEAGFSVNEAFYLLAKTDKDEGFVGLVRTSHNSGTYFKLHIVKDIAKAMLWHSMPPQEDIFHFSSVSKINVTMNFERVENPGLTKSATRIQAYIDKSKISNSLPIMVAPAPNDIIKKKASKI